MKAKVYAVYAIIFLFGFAVALNGQTRPSASSVGNPVKSSPAYAEILLRKTDLEAELESLVLEFTEEYPKIQELRFGIALLKKESERLLAVKPADTAKLTLALGKLIVRRVELETDLWKLQKNYKDEHPEVKRAKKKVEIYNAAIKEILG